MNNEKIGLVLSGGGARGSFELGVWNYISNWEGMSKITGFSGTSVGALNTALFLSKYDEIKKESIWDNMTQDDMLNDSLVEGAVKSMISGKSISEVLEDGVYDNSRLKKIMQEMSFNREQLDRLDIYSGIAKVYNIHNIKEDFISWKGKSLSEIQNLVLTSACIPGVYGSKKIDDYYLIDGGIKSWVSKYTGVVHYGNTPIKPLYDLGYRKFIVIYLKNEKNLELKRQIMWEDLLFPNMDICRIIPDKTFDDSTLSTIKINPQITGKRFKQGRDAVKKVFGVNDFKYEHIAPKEGYRFVDLDNSVYPVHKKSELKEAIRCKMPRIEIRGDLKNKMPSVWLKYMQIPRSTRKKIVGVIAATPVAVAGAGVASVIAAASAPVIVGLTATPILAGTGVSASAITTLIGFFGINIFRMLSGDYVIKDENGNMILECANSENQLDVKKSKTKRK